MNKNGEQLFKACVDGLRDFMAETFGPGRHDVVLGLSGGIDSALAAAVAVEALGADRVHAVTLPGPFTSHETLADAFRLAENLGIDLGEVEIEDAYDACVDALSWGVDLDVEDTVAGQNIQARLRMIMLMALSNANGWTVLNCGNLSEACMGYCTLYGDTVGAYGPIGGLLKTQVYAAARWLNRFEEVIPAGIIERPPSAELAEGQTDEDSLGITYADLDVILDRVLNGEEEAVAAEADPQAEAVLRRMKANRFKLAWLPPHPAV